MTPADLLHLVDRAERGSLLAQEAAALRAGIRQLARAATAGTALAAHCDTCHAHPGRPCRSILPGGQLTGPHTARIWNARKASR
jgi:hypothetical protein